MKLTQRGESSHAWSKNPCFKQHERRQPAKFRKAAAQRVSHTPAVLLFGELVNASGSPSGSLSIRTSRDRNCRASKAMASWRSSCSRALRSATVDVFHPLLPVYPRARVRDPGLCLPLDRFVPLCRVLTLPAMANLTKSDTAGIVWTTVYEFCERDTYKKHSEPTDQQRREEHIQRFVWRPIVPRGAVGTTSKQLRRLEEGYRLEHSRRKYQESRGMYHAPHRSSQRDHCCKTTNENPGMRSRQSCTTMKNISQSRSEPRMPAVLKILPISMSTVPLTAPKRSIENTCT